MRIINIYFNAVTKVSMAHLIVQNETNIEDLVKGWSVQGYCRAHYISNKIAVYIPWNNIIFAQYADDPSNAGDIAHEGE